MKDKILHTAAELFLNLGFKSVTMDDIANEMGISKKTIYQHFENKTKLIEAATLNVCEQISDGINGICSNDNNPIEEVYSIKTFVMDHLKNEKTSPQYQLQKYYPKIFAKLKQRQFEVMQNCVAKNLKRGIEQNLYRKNINIEFITRIYFSSMMTIKDQELFPLTKFSIKMLLTDFLEYHLRGICTEKGLEVLNQYINKEL